MDDQSPSLRPQDTIILLLGELKGSVSSLQASVESNNRAQAAINQQNESDHEKFRTDIGALNTDVAVLKDNRASQRYSLSERTQKWMVLCGIPGTAVAVVSLFFMFYNNK